MREVTLRLRVLADILLVLFKNFEELRGILLQKSAAAYLINTEFAILISSWSRRYVLKSVSPFRIRSLPKLTDLK